MGRRIKREDTRRTSTVLLVTLNKKTHTVSALELHCALSTEHSECTQHQCTTNLEHSHALSTQCRLTWQALAISATDLLGTKVPVRALCVVLAEMTSHCGNTHNIIFIKSETECASLKFEMVFCFIP